MRKHFRSPEYTYLKDNNFYFSRSVPVDLKELLVNQAMLI